MANDDDTMGCNTNGIKRKWTEWLTRRASIGIGIRDPIPFSLLTIRCGKRDFMGLVLTNLCCSMEPTKFDRLTVKSE